MDAFRDFDEIAVLGSVGLTRGGLMRMITLERNGNGVPTARGRSWRFGGDGCALERARGRAVPTVIGDWIAALRRTFRTAPSRLGIPAH